ncbi:MAG TPA: AAA family ATPase [Anaerolineae bacterium]|nr:AAA family ATPase [Anaerolineae bacterium]
MRLVSLEVKGLKSLRDTRIEGLDHYNVFIGKNDSGKSSILQAVALLGSLQHALQPEQVTEILTQRPAVGGVGLACEFELSDPELVELPGLQDWRGRPELDRIRRWRYEFEMRLGDERWPSRQLYLLECRLVRRRQSAPLLQVMEFQAPHSGYRSLGTAHLARVLSAAATAPLESTLAAAWRDKSTVTSSAPIQAGSRSSAESAYVRLLRGFVEGTRSLGATRQAGDEMSVQETLALERSGSNLTRVVDTIHANWTSQYAVIESLLRKLFPTVFGLHVTRRGLSAVLRVSGRHRQEPIDAFKLSEVGTGIQQTLMLAVAVVSAPEGGVLLLEEPENNLHPGAQRELAEWLREQAIKGDKQLLMTTHSTLFASNEPNCSTYLVRLSDMEGTKVAKLEAGDEAAVKEELGFRNVDLYGCNMVVLCEGDSEMVAMPIILDALARVRGKTLPSLGITWRNLGGSGNSRVKWVEEFLHLLEDIDVKPYIVVDDDANVRAGLERLVRQGALSDDAYHIWTIDKRQFGRNPSVSSEFEDNWANDQLVDVAVEMAREDGIDLGLTAVDFQTLCAESNKRTSKVLEDHCWTESRYDLDKKEVNRRLALLLAAEIGSDPKRAIRRYQVAEVAQDILAALGVVGRQDEP